MNMCKKCVGLLLFVLTTMMFVGCAEDPYDWSGDSERTVPKPVDLSLEAVEDIVNAFCSIEYHENDLSILEAGFFYGKNPDVTYETGERVKAAFRGNGFYSNLPSFRVTGEDKFYNYVGAYITTSKRTVTIGPEYAEYRW